MRHPTIQIHLLRHATIPIHQMRHATIQNEACHYSNTPIEACHYSNTPNEACPLFKIVPNEALFQETVGFGHPLFGEFQRRSALSNPRQLRSIHVKSHLKAGNGESSGRRERPGERPGALACTGRRAQGQGQGPYRPQGPRHGRNRRLQEDWEAEETSFRGSWRRGIRQRQAGAPASCLAGRIS
jgi:hypothetical protein